MNLTSLVDEHLSNISHEADIAVGLRAALRGIPYYFFPKREQSNDENYVNRAIHDGCSVAQKVICHLEDGGSFPINAAPTQQQFFGLRLRPGVHGGMISLAFELVCEACHSQTHGCASTIVANLIKIELKEQGVSEYGFLQNPSEKYSSSYYEFLRDADTLNDVNLSPEVYKKLFRSNLYWNLSSKGIFRESQKATSLMKKWYSFDYQWASWIDQYFRIE